MTKTESKESKVKAQDKPATVAKEEKAPPIAFEDIPKYKDEKGLWTFVLVNDDYRLLDVIEERKISNYYVIANSAATIELSNKQKRHVKELTLFRVVKNIVGRGMYPVYAGATGLLECGSGIRFDLPKIPIRLIHKMDHLFRAIYDEHKTEGIVLLTYDPNVGGEDGWGFLTPEQENTTAHCNYDPTSVKTLKPKGAFIVGSAHSHPMMSAFASTTDEGDQRGSDGVHITFGWSNKTAMETEYHVEIQMNEYSKEVPHQSMFAWPGKDNLSDDELKTHMQAIKKKAPAPTKVVTATKSTTNYGHMGPTTSSRITVPNFVKVSLPNSVDPTKETVVGLVDNFKSDCPFCQSMLTSIDEKHQRCISCMIFLTERGKTITDLVAKRRSSNLYIGDFDVNYVVVVDGNSVKRVEEFSLGENEDAS